MGSRPSQASTPPCIAVFWTLFRAKSSCLYSIMSRNEVPNKRVSRITAWLTLCLLLIQPGGLLADQPHEVQDQQDQGMSILAGLAAQLLQGFDGSTADMDVDAQGTGWEGLGLGTGRSLAAASELQDGFRHAADSDMWNMFRSTNTSHNVFRQSPNSNNGWFGYDMMNITDWASRIPTAGQLVEFIRNPVGSLAPEPLTPEVQAMLESDQAEAVFILALLSAIFNLVSSIFYILSGGLGTLAASLALIPAALALVTVPLGVGLSADTLLLTISQNMANRHEDWNQKFYKAWTNALARLGNALATLNDGPLRAQLAQYRKQLQEAADVLQTAYQRNYTQRFQAQFPIAAQAVAAARARAGNLRA